MKILKYLLPTSATCLLAACTSFTETLPTMSMAEMAELSDKNMCDYMLWPGSEDIENFQNELARRGLNRNQCCYRKIQKAPLYCYGYVIARGKGASHPRPSDDVQLILDEAEVTRSFTEVGTLLDTWNNSYQSGVETGPQEQVFGEKLFRLFKFGDSNTGLNREFVEERFENYYRERAREVGADALVLVIAEEGPFNNRMPVTAFASPQGQVYSTAITSSGIKTKLVFRAIRFTD